MSLIESLLAHKFQRRSDLGLNEAGIDWLRFPAQGITSFTSAVASLLASVIASRLDSPPATPSAGVTLSVCLSVRVRMSGPQTSAVSTPVKHSDTV